MKQEHAEYGTPQEASLRRAEELLRGAARGGAAHGALGRRRQARRPPPPAAQLGRGGAPAALRACSCTGLCRDWRRLRRRTIRAVQQRIRACYGCGCRAFKLRLCARCRSAVYCSKACQMHSGKAGHKQSCLPYERS
ncbi:hypothetical protein ABPG75_013807 [Micractinium tetrahymenae]